MNETSLSPASTEIPLTPEITSNLVNLFNLFPEETRSSLLKPNINLRILDQLLYVPGDPEETTVSFRNQLQLYQRPLLETEAYWPQEAPISAVQIHHLARLLYQPPGPNQSSFADLRRIYPKSGFLLAENLINPYPGLEPFLIRAVNVNDKASFIALGRHLDQIQLTPKQHQQLINHLNTWAKTPDNPLYQANIDGSQLHRQALSAFETYRRTQKLKTTAAIMIPGLVTAAALASRIFTKPTLPLAKEPIPISETYTPEWLPSTPTLPPPTSTSLPPTAETTPTQSTEQLRWQAWDEIAQAYHYLPGNHVLSEQIANEPVKANFPVFKAQILEFLTQYNMLLPGSDLVAYESQERTGVVVWVEQDGFITTVSYDGLLAPAEYIPKRFTYDLQAGTCTATASEPDPQGKLHSSQIQFDPQSPKTCLFTATTSAGRDMIGAFVPQDGQIQVLLAIVSAK
ncbi:hypothetical protein A2W24_01390 [Microgenomates group bacterium RBG_16_45_19]|nr:MAG: hypothetical protein A2W24_01390 [Microgenomates group bacterium RBG_16_45_19]